MAYNRMILVGALCATTSFSPVAASAQSLISELIVTAQKREQSQQDVGISVTTYSGEQLDALGINNSVDIISQTPGIEVSSSASGAIGTFSVRGVTQNDFSAAQESPVAVYVDEAYVSQNFVTNFSLFDIDRVEVLRGPQGTLFGRNATGGLVHYLTRKPTQDFDGYVDVEIGEDGRRKFEAAIGGGLSETVSARLSMQSNKRDALIKNDSGRDLLDIDDYAIRGQVLIEPSESFEILLKAQYAKEDDAKGGFSKRIVNADGTFSTDPTALDIFGHRDADGDPYTGSYDFDAFNTVEMTDLGVHMSWDIGGVTLTSITNYQDIEHGFGEDVDASAISGFHFAQFEDVQQISQEVRVNWEGERYRALGGIFYMNIDGDYGTVQSGEVFFGPGVFYPLDAKQETETIAAFAQGEYDLTDTLALTAGLRVNHDEKDFTFAELGTQVFEGSISDTDWSGKLQLDFRPNEDWLFYAGVNRGIKSGGFNQPFIVPADLEGELPYDSEVLTAYEAGFKADITDSLRLNSSVFYYDYDDYQVFTFDGVSVRLFNANAESYGAEVELVANPVEGLDLLAGASWLDATAKDLPTVNFPSGEITPALSPEFSLNGLVRYTWPALGGEFAAQLDANWKDDHRFDLIDNDIVSEDSYGVANARISYTGGDDTWTASLFVRNLTDTDYRMYAFDLSNLGIGLDVLGRERWFGGSFRMKL